MARPALKPGPLWRVSIATTPEAEDAVTEMLGAVMGCPAVSYFDARSGRSRVTVYCRHRPAASLARTLAAKLRHINHCGLGTGPGRLTFSKLPQEDWAESWKRHFKPIDIGGALLVKPRWSARRPRINQGVIWINPGLSFGTGRHPTTEFCLREIARRRPATNDKARRGSRSFLDIGTGSGILAIAAAKLGFRPVRGFDSDPGAVRIARANARANRVRAKLSIGLGDVARLSLRPMRKHDLICANLVADLLIAKRRRICAQLRPGGMLVLAGILKSEFPVVRKAYEKSGLKLVQSRTGGEWRSGTFESRNFF